MPEIKLILSAKQIPVTYDAFETCWFLDLKYGNRLTDITNGSYDHCLEQKRHWQSVIDRGEIEALIPSCRPPQNTMTTATTYTAAEKAAIAEIRAALKLKRLDPRRLYIVDDGAYSWIGDRAELTAANAKILRDVKNSTEEQYEAACRCRCLAASHGGGDANFFDLPESWRDGSALGPISPL